MMGSAGQLKQRQAAYAVIQHAEGGTMEKQTHDAFTAVLVASDTAACLGASRRLS